MAEPVGSENPFLKLYMRQLSLNWVVLFSSLSHLSTVAKAIRELVQDRPQPVLEEAELSTALVPKVNTGESKMARTPYVTVRDTEPAPPTPPPQETPMTDVGTDPDTVYLADADRVEKLLDIITNTANWPNVPCIRQAAQNELAQIEADLRAQLYPEQVAAEEAAAKAAQEAEEARLKRVEEEKAKAKKEKEYA